MKFKDIGQGAIFNFGAIRYVAEVGDSTNARIFGLADKVFFSPHCEVCPAEFKKVSFHGG